MARSARRRTFRLECLEGRQLMRAGGPTAEAQAMIERIDAARANPAAIADWVFADAENETTLEYYHVDKAKVQSDLRGIAPRPALAWDERLAAAAQSQSDYQVSIGQQTHSGPNGIGLGQRLDPAGYTDRVEAAENAYAYSRSVDHAMRAFLIDWGVDTLGHRTNLLQPDPSARSFKEIGIGITNTDRGDIGPKVITQDFGLRNTSPTYLLGVAYYQDGDGFYKPGEGRGNVDIEAVNVQTHAKFSVQTWDDSGAYQLPLEKGTYQVTARVDSRVVKTQRVDIGDDNVKVDFHLNEAWQGSAPQQETPETQVVEQSPAVVQPAPISNPAPTQNHDAAKVEDKTDTSSHDQTYSNGLTVKVDLGSFRTFEGFTINYNSFKEYDNIHN